MTTPTITSSTDSQMHNNIMTAGSRDRPPMLAAGRYPQWRSRFLRYIDTRPNDKALRKCILSSPYKPITILVQAVDATDDSLAISKPTTVETPMNMSLENKAHFKAEKEAIHLILIGIGDEIYLTVDACQTAQEIFYKLMNEMIKNNLIVVTMQVNVQFLQQLQPEWSRFVTIVKQQHKLDEVSYHKLFDILKQYQKEVNELCTERLARNANPLALVATAQVNQDPYYQTSKSYKSHAPSPKPSIPTRSHTTTRHKGKEIAKLITPPSKTASEEDIDPEQELEAHYSYMAKIQEVPTADTGTDSEPVEQNDQDDVESDDKRVALANLIANLKLDVDENKKIQKKLKKAYTTLAQELKECKTILEETSKSLGESISVRDSCLVA
nr:hypothetical protein [Tanacetum cinerariifolium]